ELALVNHPAGLERIGDDPEPALAGAARLRVAVVLETVEALDLDVDGRHVVARQVANCHLLAKLLIVDEIGHEDPEARPPSALDARVIVALLGDCGRRWPA